MKINLESVLENINCATLEQNRKFQTFLQTGEYEQTYGEERLVLKEIHDPEDEYQWLIIVQELNSSKQLELVNWTERPEIRLEVITGQKQNPNQSAIDFLFRYFKNEEEKDLLVPRLDEEELHLCRFFHYHQRIALRVGGSSLTDLSFQNILARAVALFNEKKNNRPFYLLNKSRAGVQQDIAIVWLKTLDMNVAYIQEFQNLCQHMIGNGGFYRPEELKNETKKQGH